MMVTSLLAEAIDSPAEADRLAYFQTLLDGFARAEQAAGAVTRYYSMGGYTLGLRFAGPALLPHLTPALAHLETAPTDTPALTVCLWDSASTGTRLPLLVNSLVHLLRLRWFEQLDGRRAIRGYNSQRIRTTFHLGPDILSALDSQANLAVYWVEDAAHIPYYERGYPLQTILNWWLGDHQRYFVHAGAVGRPDGGVLLAGQSGSGKSTTTLTCLDSGLSLAADDYTLVAVDPAPIGYSLYNTAKLRTVEDMGKFPHLMARLSNTDRLAAEKPMLFLQEGFPDRVLTQFPLRAILLPQVTGGPTTSVAPVSPMIALKTLAPSTLLQLPGAGQASFQAMARLVRQVPCYTLALGTDLAQIPVVIDDVLGAIA
ncbi:MAG: serine kinase [Anaerolineae bacterium]|nr:serine kinase [Anaerolineae bacterium]